MDHTDAAETLSTMVEASGKTEVDLTSADLLNLMLKFFETPCNGATCDDDGNGLQFQCGVYDWGDEKDFEVDFVRQFSIDGFDGEFSHYEQLHATLYYAPELAAGQDIAISLWNTQCTDLADFRRKVTESAGYRLTENAIAAKFKIHQERV